MTIMSTVKAIKVELNIESRIISVEVAFEFSPKDTDRNEDSIKIINGKLIYA